MSRQSTSIVAVQAASLPRRPMKWRRRRQVVRAVLSHALLRGRAASRGAWRALPGNADHHRAGRAAASKGRSISRSKRGQGFMVVDFKTDRAEGELQASYARQVQLYAEAIAQATGSQRARC